MVHPEPTLGLGQVQTTGRHSRALSLKEMSVYTGEGKICVLKQGCPPGLLFSGPNFQAKPELP
jgi:hypothetical protein